MGGAVTYAARLYRAAKGVTDTFPARGLGWRALFLPADLRAAVRELARVVNERRFPLEGERR